MIENYHDENYAEVIVDDIVFCYGEPIINFNNKS